jgi:hypothetical protein
VKLLQRYAGKDTSLYIGFLDTLQNGGHGNVRYQQLASQVLSRMASLVDSTPRPREREESPEEQALRRRRREAVVVNDGDRAVSQADIIQRNPSSSLPRSDTQNRETRRVERALEEITAHARGSTDIVREWITPIPPPLASYAQLHVEEEQPRNAG